jgi:hypothetical protein
VGRVQAGDGLQLLEADRPRPPPLRTRSPSRVRRTYRAYFNLYLCLSVTVRGAQHLAVLCSVGRRASRVARETYTHLLIVSTFWWTRAPRCGWGGRMSYEVCVCMPFFYFYLIFKAPSVSRTPFYDFARPARNSGSASA